LNKREEIILDLTSQSKPLTRAVRLEDVKQCELEIFTINSYFILAHCISYDAICDQFWINNQKDIALYHEPGGELAEDVGFALKIYPPHSIGSILGRFSKVD